MTSRGDSHLRSSLSFALSVLGLHDGIHRLARRRVTVHRTAIILGVMRNWRRRIAGRMRPVDGGRGRHRRTVVETHGPTRILGMLRRQMWWRRRTVVTWREAVCHVAGGIRSAKVRYRSVFSWISFYWGISRSISRVRWVRW